MAARREITKKFARDFGQVRKIETWRMLSKDYVGVAAKSSTSGRAHSKLRRICPAADLEGRRLLFEVTTAVRGWHA